MSDNYSWKFCSLGGVSRVKISSGEDIAHLRELDQKLWTALSCPVDGLEFNAEFLKFLDTDSDKRIRVNEVVEISEWVCSILKDKDLLLKSTDVLPLAAFNTDSVNGSRLYQSAKQVLSNLGKSENDSITLADTSNTEAIFANTTFNGDGVVCPESASDDLALKDAIECALNCVPAVKDRSGKAGVDVASITAFYDALNAYKQWCDAKKEEHAPYGENTAKAFELFNAIKDKVDDFFLRCEYYIYDPACEAAKDIPEALSHPCEDKLLHYNKINPMWAACFNAFKTAVLDVDFPKAEALSKAQWEQVCGRIGLYKAYMDAKAGAQVEGLGIEKVEALLADSKLDSVKALIEKDLALTSEADSICELHKLLVVYRYLYEFLNNFVLFGNFYDRNKLSVFDAGQLYIDQRCIKLCIKVADLAKQAAIAPQSGMYILYCDCVCPKTGKKLTIAAVLTNGDTDSLRVGMNGVFYDRNGVDYDATVTKIIDNPTSLRQAFMHPYKKLAKTLNEKLAKNALDKQKDIKDMKGFDPNSLAILVAGLGVSAGVVLNALSAIVKPWYTPLVIMAGLCLLVSGPSVFVTWLKLRKRNLGPILNANSWAINSVVVVNAIFGAALTTTANYPKVSPGSDPYFVKKKNGWKKWVVFLFVVGGIVAAMYFKCK